MAFENIEELPCWVHLGVAKGASSALQQYYFSVHPELLSLGLGGYGNSISWSSNALQMAMEVDLRCTVSHLYNASEVERVFRQEVEKLGKMRHKRAGFSYENLSCTLGHDVSLVEKATRLRTLLGANTKILYVVREQKAYLQSLYKELLLWGLNVQYAEFIERLVYTNFQGIISDLQYAEILHVYQELFGDSNVLAVSFQQVIHNTAETLKNISGFLGVSDCIHALPKVHKGLTNIQAQWLLERNRSHIHDFRRDRFAIWHGQRLDEYSRQHWDNWVPREIVDNRSQGIESARLARQITVGEPISFELNLELERRLEACFTASNQRLYLEYGIDLQSKV